jgi:hypothetical protein
MDIFKIIETQEGKDRLPGEVVYKNFTVDIDTALQKVNETFQLDNGSKKVLGFRISSNIEEQPKNRGLVQIQVGGKYLCDAETDVKMLMAGYNVAPLDRFFPVLQNIRLTDNNIKFVYEDTEHPNVPHTPYTLYITFWVLR